ncbi:L,D-transpeptidase family protein [Flavobacterium sp. MFBS3-15]|uniref:L,D-transpeptidase family protein n=1 Tax=Flavobacterium sp. MFBS3-15 TaxID=2989816 RepID=UPI002235ABF8|nr:L,D-transpeptidase family protein [Flavobacterium sp. MFBS3-15]MCW4469348.1 L,D-transpeptidase family protein [Flavobacterium sp. MFBS3-15]
MLRAVSIALLVLFLFPACKNARKENFPVKAASTAYLKNTPIAIDAGLLEKSSEAVKEFYASHELKTIWTTPDNRKKLITAIKDTASDGLQPEDYSLNTLEQFEALDIISKEDCMRYDILLTESFSKLATHLFKGKLLPGTVYHDWALAPKTLDTNTLLAEVLEKGNMSEVMGRCRPKHAVYGGLRKSLAYLDSLPDDAKLEKIEAGTTLKVNDSSAVVAIVKKRLAYWGDLKEATGGVYDKATAKAVKKFQQRHGLAATGIVDPKTAEALNITRNDRRNQVIANLERWRWFPYDFGKRAIIVNIPTYQLAVVENNRDTIDTYKVIVGKPDRRSPVLYSAINQLTINPTWTIPPTYLKKDLVPAARKDTAHFAHLNLKIFYKNEEIPVSEWDSLKADHYVYVQSPGSHNSLGRIKFNFRNGFYVYLHDTNHREYFSKGYRALSSGCIRVEDPFRLAGYVLEDDKATDRKKLDEMVEEGETQYVALKKTTPIHQLYWTAWMDRDGLQFRNDIYNLDKVLYDKLRKKS